MGVDLRGSECCETAVPMALGFYGVDCLSFSENVALEMRWLSRQRST